MNCLFAEKVSALIDGELTTSEAHALELHLLDCEECRQLHADFLTLNSQIGNYPRRPLPKMSPALAQRLSPPPFAGRALPTPVGFVGMVRNPLLAGLAAMLLIGAVIGLVSYTVSRKSGSDRNLLADRSPKAAPSPVPSPVASPGQRPRQSRDEQHADQEAPPKFRRREAVTINKPNVRRREEFSEPGPIQFTAGNESRGSSEANNLPTTTAADTETLSAQHVEQSELLLRSFRNVRMSSDTEADDLNHERARAQKLFYQNLMLRREADRTGDVEFASLLDSLEPILLDIANLPEHAPSDQVNAIKDRMERQNLVALLQINSRIQARNQ